MKETFLMAPPGITAASPRPAPRVAEFRRAVSGFVLSFTVQTGKPLAARRASSRRDSTFGLVGGRGAVYNRWMLVRDHWIWLTRVAASLLLTAPSSLHADTFHDALGDRFGQQQTGPTAALAP